MLRILLDPIRQLYEDVKRKALMRLEYEGLHKAEAITTPGARFYQDPTAFAMDRYAYYVCFKCKKVGKSGVSFAFFFFVGLLNKCHLWFQTIQISYILPEH